MVIITDVNGNTVLRGQSSSHKVNNSIPVLRIDCLGFHGIPSALLRKHGLFYTSNGINALDLERGGIAINKAASTHLSDPVTHLELSVRSSNNLEKMGIETIAQLVVKSEEDLLEYKRFGRTHVMEVKEALMNIGLTLNMVI